MNVCIINVWGYTEILPTARVEPDTVNKDKKSPKQNFINILVIVDTTAASVLYIVGQ